MTGSPTGKHLISKESIIKSIVVSTNALTTEISQTPEYVVVENLILMKTVTECRIVKIIVQRILRK